MMTGDGEHPVASGEPLVAPEATNELIVAAVKAFGPHIRGAWQWWEQHKDNIKACCSPAQIDKEESLGYLLADALGHPLLVPEDARAVGKRGFAQAKAAEKRMADEQQVELTAARRSARTKGASVGAAQREAAIAAAHARVLGTKYDLTLPARTVGAKKPRTKEQRCAASVSAEMEEQGLPELCELLLESHAEVQSLLNTRDDFGYETPRELIDTWKRLAKGLLEIPEQWRMCIAEWQAKMEALDKKGEKLWSRVERVLKELDFITTEIEEDEIDDYGQSEDFAPLMCHSITLEKMYARVYEEWEITTKRALAIQTELVRLRQLTGRALVDAGSLEIAYESMLQAPAGV